MTGPLGEELLFTEPVAGLLLSLTDDGQLLLHGGGVTHYVSNVPELIDRMGSAFVLAHVRSTTGAVVRADGVHLYPLNGQAGQMFCTGWPEGHGRPHVASFIVWAPGHPWTGDCACDEPTHQDHTALRALVPGIES